MTNSNRLQSKCFKLFITLFMILSSNPSFVNTEQDFTFNQQITNCAKNSPGSTILQFQTNYNTTLPKIQDDSTYELDNITSHGKYYVKLKKSVSGEKYSFKIEIDVNSIEIRGNFCDNSSTSSKCTVIIAFLASLCLILFTALALTLIILRRKKPITFKFGQKDDKDCDRKQFNDNYEENYENNHKKSVDVTNNIVTNNVNNNSNSLDSPRVLQPRKSSLKPSTKGSDQLNNNNLNAHENGAFNGTELEVVNEDNEDKVEDKPNLEMRRKSVAFSDTTQVKYG